MKQLIDFKLLQDETRTISKVHFQSQRLKHKYIIRYYENLRLIKTILNILHSKFCTGLLTRRLQLTALGQLCY
jgi:hypothetical protein